MNTDINPCLSCDFGWKDYCSPDKRQECIEIYRQQKGKFAEGEGVE